MPRLIVATSRVEDGNMYIPTDPANEAVIENRTKWLKKQGIALEDATRVCVSYDQTNFCRYYQVGNQNKGEAMQNRGVLLADALVAVTPNHALFLPVADCVATVFFDEEHSVLMLSHLGRHSLEQQGGVKSVEYLKERYGSNPMTLKVWLAPSPSKDAYPIFALNSKGMKETVFEQLAEAGIASGNITDNPADTASDPNYYSHTAFLKGDKPDDGRFAMIAMMIED
jgi:copper oxidase (laccase) domain-containing protein